MDALLQKARKEFATLFAEDATHYGWAPGNAELFGALPYYADGLALALAIDRSVAVVGRPVAGDTARVYSLTFNSGASFRVDEPAANPRDPWLNRIMGVVWQWRIRGAAVGGFEALVAGDVPLGAGLASSAALDLAAAHFLKALAGFAATPAKMAQGCVDAERGFMGVEHGPRDQLASALGEAGKLVFLDYRERRTAAAVAVPESVALVAADTNSPRTPLPEDIGSRIDSWRRVAQRIFGDTAGAARLRDAKMEQLDAVRGGLPDEDFRRARHAVGENARARSAAAALAAGDCAAFGRLMTESQVSCRDDFESSCREIDAMIGIAAGLPGWHGSRQVGCGFGGSVVSLVDATAAGAFRRELESRYYAATGLKAGIGVLGASAGASGGGW